MYRISVALLLAAAPVFAEPATKEGAAGIEAALRTYLGQVPELLTVTPEGESYAVSLNSLPLPGLSQLPGATVTMSPVELKVTALGGTRWSVEGAGPWSLDVRVPGLLSFEMKMAGQEGSGTYDTALAAMESWHGEASGLSMVYHVTPPGQPPQDVAYTIDSLTFSSAAKASSAGGVDSTLNYDVKGISESLVVPTVPDQPGLPVELALDGYSIQSTATALRSRELLDLLAWFVAHPGEASVKADEAGMKAAISAALPLWNRVEATGTGTGLTVTTPFGSGGAESLAFGIDLNGAVTDGRFGERLSLKGLALPTELIPGWAHPLLPKDIDFDVAVSGFDAGAAARLLLSELTFAAPPAPDFDGKLVGALLPEGAVTVSLGSTGVTGPNYDLHMTGGLDAGPGRLPVGAGSVVLSGIDAILAALGQAPEDIRQGAVPGLLMLRGLARAEGGKLIWDLAATADGKMLVNGGDISGLVGK